MYNEILESEASETDTDIIELLFARNELGLILTDKRYGKRILRISLEILGDEYDAEQCENDTYERIWNTIPPKRPNNYQWYVYKTVRNISLNMKRSDERQKRIPKNMIVSLEEYEETTYYNEQLDEQIRLEELKKCIREYLYRYPTKWRYAFMKKYFFGEDTKAIAKKLSLTESAVNKHLKKITDGLKAYLIERGMYNE